MRIHTTLFAYFFLACPYALANTTTSPSIVSSSNDMLSNSFRVIWGLLIVLGVILLLYGLLKKRFSLLSTHPDKEIKIIEIKPLMGKKALCLIEVRGKEYLLGVSETQINTIATLPDRDYQSFSDTLKQQNSVKDD